MSVGTAHHKYWWGLGMKTARRELGDRGEDLAAAALKKQGYKIIERNYKTPLGEIDLIARQGKTLIFIEVKTRKSLHFGAPQEAVSPAKQVRLRRLADYYLKQKRLTEAKVRFDVVAVTLTAEGPQIEIIPGAF
jgi:putative endonuclease